MTSFVEQLEEAILYGDFRAVVADLDAHPDRIDARFSGNLDLTPLMWACRNRRESIVAELLRRGADPRLINRAESNGDGGNTALWFTAQGPSNGTTGIATHLLAAGADVNAPGEYGLTPLHIAAAWCHLDLVQLLLDHAADPQIKSISGQTPAAFVQEQFDRFAGQSPLNPDQRRFIERAPRMLAFFESVPPLQRRTE